MYKYTKIQGPRFQKNYIIAIDQESDLHETSFQSSPKINRMLITRSICIQPWVLTTRALTTIGSYNQGVLTTGGSYSQGSYNQEFL